MKPYKALNGKEEPWFTLSDAYTHYGWLWVKATEGRISSVENFLSREFELRVTAIGYMLEGERLNLSKALAQVRREGGSTWQGFVTDQASEGMSPLSVNPMKRQGGPLAGPAAKANKLSDIGVQRASIAKEKTPDGKPARLLHGNREAGGAFSLPDGRKGTLCTDFRTGVGCAKWPCGGTHACDVLIAKENFKACLGPHSRKNCPHNR